MDGSSKGQAPDRAASHRLCQQGAGAGSRRESASEDHGLVATADREAVRSPSPFGRGGAQSRSFQARYSVSTVHSTGASNPGTAARRPGTSRPPRGQRSVRAREASAVALDPDRVGWRFLRVGPTCRERQPVTQAYRMVRPRISRELPAGERRHRHPGASGATSVRARACSAVRSITGQSALQEGPAEHDECDAAIAGPEGKAWPCHRVPRRRRAFSRDPGRGRPWRGA